MRINVLEFLPTIEDGGVSSVVSNYCKYINKDKFDISVLTLFSLIKSNSYKNILNSQCDVSSILKCVKKWDSSIFVRFFKKVLSKKIIAYRLKRIILKKRIDVIHAHIDVLQYLFEIEDFLANKNIKIYYTCHSLPTRWIGETYFEENKAVKSLLAYKRFTICALHEKMCGQIKKLLNTNKVIVLKNPIDLFAFDFRTNNKEDLKEQIRIPNNSFVIGNVCRLTESKNLMFLLDIFNECLKLDNSCFLLLVCSGKQIIKNKILDKIKYLSIENRVKLIENPICILNYYKCINVFCSPSLFEGFGLSVLEAQASKLNCVYSNIYPKEVNHNINNIILSTNDLPIKWAKAILSLKNKAAIIDSKINDYNINKIIKIVESLYSTY